MFFNYGMHLVADHVQGNGRDLAMLNGHQVAASPRRLKFQFSFVKDNLTN
jgi:hypothetical protein